MNRTKKILISSFMSLAVVVSAGTPFVSASHASTKSTAKEDVIIVYKNKTGKEKALKTGSRLEHQYQALPAVAMTATAANVQALKKDPNIAYVEKNVHFKIQNTKAVPVTAAVAKEESQWGFQDVKAVDAWKAGYTGKGIKVAVLDTGIAPHSDLKVAGGTSTVSYTTSYTDDNGHGTHVAGIIAAQQNGVGTVGVAPDVSLYAVKALDQDGEGDLQDILKGLDWAIQNHMDMVNMSLGTPDDSQAFHDMVDKAYQSGTLVICAAGNDGNADGTGDNVNYPADYSSAIAVGAVDSNLKRAYFSSTGNKVEFTAPGVNIVSTYLHNGYEMMSGTSMATPYVTGLFALLKQEYPTLSDSELRTKMDASVKDLGAPGRDPLYGFGFAEFSQAAKTAPVQAPSVPAVDPALKTQVKKAEKAVELAEQLPIQYLVNDAQKQINQLPDSTDKTGLQQKLDQVKARILQAQIKEAERAVQYAKTYKTPWFVNFAQNYVSALPDGDTKTSLQDQLDKVKNAIQIQKVHVHTKRR
ncbi:S8 family peptidase [Heyndrickxia acidicola]|uniref:S8 family peptidase n=1 Tax=Heyndrickxia acidicola TaxID=209389 RepID=A0ABU6ML59_9BACI|nr:S8 family peptidase [Heyndrickxia acidicola]MED1204373.1 S8 family peptidase [Heyndrickxia acidicola]